MSISSYGEDAILDAIFNAASLSVASRFVKLHTGDPGESGATNAAGETRRRSLSGAPAAAGTFSSVNDLVWTDVAATETYTHMSIWDASSGGNCLWTGALAAPKFVETTDTFTIPAGSLTVNID